MSSHGIASGRAEARVPSEQHEKASPPEGAGRALKSEGEGEDHVTELPAVGEEHVAAIEHPTPIGSHLPRKEPSGEVQAPHEVEAEQVGSKTATESGWVVTGIWCEAREGAEEVKEAGAAMAAHSGAGTPRH